MKLAVLFSGGKDSTYALAKAMEKDEVVCLITVVSTNKESYMFHTPNVHLAGMQAEAIGLPLVKKATEGKKEEELADLETAIMEAKRKFAIEGIVTGAIASVYQSQRVQVICDKLGLWCFNPLWQKNPDRYWEEILDLGFKIIIVSVSAESLGKDWLGKEIDKESLIELEKLSKKHHFHLGFEGGEAETFVADCNIFKKRLEILSANKLWDGNSGVYEIKEAELVGK